jgi:regulator of cell morphogenesis and NO signaling
MTVAETLTPNSTLTQLIRELPQAAIVFEEAEIDYSCRGARTLAEAAKAAGYRADESIERLQASSNRPAIDWFQRPLSQLVAFLISDHVQTITVRAPAIREAIERAIAMYGDIQTLRRIRVLFADVISSIGTHVLKEERELFPIIAELERARNDSVPPPKARLGPRVLHELVEHEEFRDRARLLQTLAQELPEDVVIVFLRKELRTFARELHNHMHLENNVLYPRAIEVENELRRSPVTSGL